MKITSHMETNQPRRLKLRSRVISRSKGIKLSLSSLIKTKPITRQLRIKLLSIKNGFRVYKASGQINKKFRVKVKSV